MSAAPGTIESSTRARSSGRGVRCGTECASASATGRRARTSSAQVAHSATCASNARRSSGSSAPSTYGGGERLFVVRRAHSRSSGAGPRQGVAQLEQRDPDARLHGAERLFETGGNLRLGQPLEVRELDGDALDQRQPLQRLADARRVARRVERVERIRRASPAVRSTRVRIPGRRDQAGHGGRADDRSPASVPCSAATPRRCRGPGRSATPAATPDRTPPGPPPRRPPRRRRRAGRGSRRRARGDRTGRRGPRRCLARRRPRERRPRAAHGRGRRATKSPTATSSRRDHTVTPADVLVHGADTSPSSPTDERASRIGGAPAAGRFLAGSWAGSIPPRRKLLRCRPGL